METIVRGDEVESEGDSVASSCQDRDAAVRCWRTIVATSGLQEKVIAAAAGMTPSYYSKVASGQQGDFLGMIFTVGQSFPAMKRAFIAGLAEIEGADPLTQAVEQLVTAALRFMKLQSEVLPLRMARATLSDERKRGVA